MKYLLALLISFLMPGVGDAAEAEKNDSIGYSSVSEALQALQARPDAKISVHQGWTIVDVNNGKDMTLWSFAPEDHPAHPAAIKRDILEKDGSVYKYEGPL